MVCLAYLLIFRTSAICFLDRQDLSTGCFPYLCQLNSSCLAISRCIFHLLFLVRVDEQLCKYLVILSGDWRGFRFLGIPLRFQKHALATSADHSGKPPGYFKRRSQFAESAKETKQLDLTYEIVTCSRDKSNSRT